MKNNTRKTLHPNPLRPRLSLGRFITKRLMPKVTKGHPSKGTRSFSRSLRKRPSSSGEIDRLYDRIYSCKNSDELRQILPDIAEQVKTNLSNTIPPMVGSLPLLHDIEPTYKSFVVISFVVDYLLERKLPEEQKYKLEQLEQKHCTSPFPGRELKQHNFLHLTSESESAKQILNSCEDDKTYYPVRANYFISDNKSQFLCEKENGDSIHRIHSYSDIQNMDEGTYLYSVLPDYTLCLFDMDLHHSYASCGQPVICAGHMQIARKNDDEDDDMVVRDFDNMSGHYRASADRLTEVMEMLRRKGIIRDDIKVERVNTIRSIMFDN